MLAVATPTAAQTTAQTPPAAPASTTPSMSVDEIVAKHLATKGGADKWKTIQNQKMTGVATAQGFQLVMTVYARRPNQSRQELSIDIPGQPAATMVNIFDGEKAWMINPMSGSSAPQAMPDADTAIAKAQSDFDGALVDYKAKGYTVVLMAPAAVAGKTAHHLKVTRADLPTQHFYLDPVTFVELKVSTEGPSGSETELSDYKTIEGIMVPHSITIMQGGAVQAELKIQTVTFNTPMAETLFKVK
jgi:hypothetical protein